MSQVESLAISFFIERLPRKPRCTDMNLVKNAAPYFLRLRFHGGIGRSEKVRNIQKSRVSVEDHVARARQKRARLRWRSSVPRFHRGLFSKSFGVRGASHHRLRRFKRTRESNRSRWAVNLGPSTSNVSFLFLPTFFLLSLSLSLSLSLCLFRRIVALVVSPPLANYVFVSVRSHDNIVPVATRRFFFFFFVFRAADKITIYFAGPRNAIFHLDRARSWCSA